PTSRTACTPSSSLSLHDALPIYRTRFLERTADIHWGLMVCVYGVSHVPALLSLEIRGYEGQNLKLLVFFVLVVQASDVLQYEWRSEEHTSELQSLAYLVCRLLLE